MKLGLLVAAGMVIMLGLSNGMAAELDIPVMVNGQGAATIVGSWDGYNWLPPQLVEVSVPFSRGQVQPNEKLMAVDAWDRPLPTEQRVLATWPDGSVRWLRLQFESHQNLPKWTINDYSEEKENTSCQLPWDYRIRRGQSPEATTKVQLIEQDGKVIIDNGRLIITIDPKNDGFGFTQVQVKGLDRAAAGALRFGVDWEDKQFTTRRSQARLCTVEEASALRVVVKLQGRFEDVYEWTTRLIVHAGEPAIRAEHTLGGLGDRQIDRVKRIYLEYPSGLEERFVCRAGGESVELDGQIEAGETVTLHQYPPQLLHPATDFYYDLVVSGRGVPELLGRGGRSIGWLRCSDDKLTAGVAVRDFAAKAPKAVQVSSDGLWRVDLWPPDSVLKLSRGRAITHEVLYSFYPAVARPQPEMGLEAKDPDRKFANVYRTLSTEDLHYRSYLRPIIPAVNVEYMCATKAFGPQISMAGSKLPEYEATLRANFETFLSRHLDRAEAYGMMNYGDYIAPLGSDDGENPDRPHWRDHEWEYGHDLWSYYLRTGDVRAYNLADAAYRHYIDVDCRYNQGINAYHGSGSHGEMHVEFRGLEIGHIVVVSQIDAYLFTGDPRSLEAAQRQCRYHMDRFNQGPEVIRKMFQQQTRAISWPTLGLTRMYEMTHDAACRQAVEKILDVLETSKQEVLDRTKGTWQVSLLMAVLGEFHRVTGDERARRLFLELADWHIANYYLPELRAMGQRSKDNPYGYGEQLVQSGPTLMFAAAPLAYAYELTKDPYYLEVCYQLTDEGMKWAREGLDRTQAPVKRRGYPAATVRSCGKWFSLMHFYSEPVSGAFSTLSNVELDRIRHAHPAWRVGGAKK